MMFAGAIAQAMSAAPWYLDHLLKVLQQHPS